MLAAISAVGTLISGMAQAQASAYQAAVARSNQEQAKVNAKLAIEKAEIDAQDRATENAGLMGLQVARQGASGLSLSSPSLIRTRARSIEIAREETDRIYRGGYAQEANFITESNQFGAQADMYSAQSGFSMLSGFIGAATQFGSMISQAPATAQS